jgi:thiol:disulfide interchange protein DsbD
MQRAKTDGKPVFLDFYADWCLPCKKMELTTFSEERVARELERFTLVKVDMTTDDNPEVVEVGKRYGAETLPTLVLIDTCGRVVHKVDHEVEPDELLPLLESVHENRPLCVSR